MKYIKTVKTATCSEDFYCGDDFDAVLAIFSSYRYDANTTEAVEKISKMKMIIKNAPYAL